MLHMILGILKAIGLIIGILLLILLAVLLALILVPLRYKLTAKLLAEEYELSLRGSWLLHIVSASMSADSANGRGAEIRLFGIRLPLFRPADVSDDKKEKRDRKTEEQSAGKEQKAGKGQKTGKEQEAREEQKKRQTEETERREEKNPATDAGQEAEEQTNEEQTNEEPDRGILRKIWFQCRRICGKIRQIIRRIVQAAVAFRRGLVNLKERVVKLGRRVAALLRRPGELREFIEAYELRGVFGSLAGYLLLLITHYKPRRIEGYLRFGTDDPSVTGQLTGLIYLLLPARADRYSVEPEFNETVLETETVCSGHIRALHVLRVLWRAFRDKKLRRVIREWKKRGES